MCEKNINKKYLNEILQKYYGNENTKEAQKVCEYILDNRLVEVKENIKLKRTN